jgi:hypothetical protein
MVYIEGGRSEIDEWRAMLSPSTRQKLDDFIFHLRRQTAIQYPLKGLTGADGIFELVLGLDAGVQQRPLGCVGPGPREFTLLLPATKQERRKKTIWDPRAAVTIAERRRAIVLGMGGRRFIREFSHDPPATN